MNISKISKPKISRNPWDDTSLSLIILRMCTILLVTFWPSSRNPATPVLPNRCASNLSEIGSIDSELIYPMVLMLWTEDRVVFLPEEMYFFRDTRRKLEDSYFFQFLPEEIGRNGRFILFFPLDFLNMLFKIINYRYLVYFSKIVWIGKPF